MSAAVCLKFDARSSMGQTFEWLSQLWDVPSEDAYLLCGA
jgi:hypothetical protein